MAADRSAMIAQKPSARSGFADLKEMRAWACEDYDPERFDLDAANAAIAAI